MTVPQLVLNHEVSWGVFQPIPEFIHKVQDLFFIVSAPDRAVSNPVQILAWPGESPDAGIHPSSG